MAETWTRDQLRHFGLLWAAGFHVRTIGEVFDIKPGQVYRMVARLRLDPRSRRARKSTNPALARWLIALSDEPDEAPFDTRH